MALLKWFVKQAWLVSAICGAIRSVLHSGIQPLVSQSKSAEDPASWLGWEFLTNWRLISALPVDMTLC